MSKRIINLYLHVHQPFRIRHYTIFDIGANHQYFNDSTWGNETNNEFILKKVAEKSYLPTNAILQELLEKHDHFKLSLSITGTVIEQMRLWSPESLASFKRLVDTGKVEILAETYYHSLAFFYSRDEFEKQVDKHHQMIKEEFGLEPQVFRNTELSYNNDLAYWADKKGYKGIITEGWDQILGWRSPNYVYRPAYTENIRLLLKNYKLSDDIAFRFSDKNWSEWPVDADKFNVWIDGIPDDQPILNLFMDYETFGEHQWESTGIFDFLRHFPEKFLSNPEHEFLTLSETIDRFEPVDFLDVPNTITWADTDRDLTAWLGNPMQQQAINNLYSLESKIVNSNDDQLIDDWRKLQTSDHFYYMCTKWFNDGDVHAYFSPYKSPYEAHINFMNAFHDLNYRIKIKENENV